MKLHALLVICVVNFSRNLAKDTVEDEESISQKPDFVTVKVQSGTLRGVKYSYDNGKRFAFLGIPYGKAPLREQRFKVCFCPAVRREKEVASLKSDVLLTKLLFPLVCIFTCGNKHVVRH